MSSFHIAKEISWPTVNDPSEQMASSSGEQIHRGLKSHPPRHPSDLNPMAAFPHPGDELQGDSNGLLYVSRTSSLQHAAGSRPRFTPSVNTYLRATLTTVTSHLYRALCQQRQDIKKYLCCILISFKIV